MSHTNTYQKKAGLSLLILHSNKNNNKGDFRTRKITKRHNYVMRGSIH